MGADIQEEVKLVIVDWPDCGSSQKPKPYTPEELLELEQKHGMEKAAALVCERQHEVLNFDRIRSISSIVSQAFGFANLLVELDRFISIDCALLHGKGKFEIDVKFSSHRLDWFPIRGAWCLVHGIITEKDIKIPDDAVKPEDDCCIPQVARKFKAYIEYTSREHSCCRRSIYAPDGKKLIDEKGKIGTNGLQHYIDTDYERWHVDNDLLEDNDSPFQLKDKVYAI